MNTIGRCIRMQRQKKNMTQAQLALLLDVQYQTVSKWETGTTVPDTLMLPRLADALEIQTDDLFGRRRCGRSGEFAPDQKDFLLRTYAQMYGPEAGPWNLSVENKYLEFRITDFFEKQFSVSENAGICNIGIGAGEWDLYLSYKLRGGMLTSIDREEICCRQLEQRLLFEENPNEVRVVCGDAMDLCFDGAFDIVTMVGSTIEESGGGLLLLEKAMGFVKSGGSLYYQSLSSSEDCDAVIRAAHNRGFRLGAMETEAAYGYLCRYYRLEKC